MMGAFNLPPVRPHDDLRLEPSCHDALPGVASLEAEPATPERTAGSERRTVALVLAQGPHAPGALGSLVASRSPAALPIAGSYRLIDFALSNCVNAGVTRVGLVTQYEPASLLRHVGGGEPWRLVRRTPEHDGLDRDGDGLSLLQPYVSPDREASWYAGSADAVRENLALASLYRADTVLVVPGDHLHLMDYRELLELHQHSCADVTIAVARTWTGTNPGTREVRMDGNGRIRGLGTRSAVRSRVPIAGVPMGIYAFRVDALASMLAADARGASSGHDLDADVLPRAIEAGASVQGYMFDDAWRALDSAEGYWAANMELLASTPPLAFDHPLLPVFTRETMLPPARLGSGAVLRQSIISDGAAIEGHVEHSVLSPGVQVEAGAIVRDSVLLHGAHIEAGAVVERAIVDEGAVVQARARVGANGVSALDGEARGLRTSRLTIVSQAERPRVRVEPAPPTLLQPRRRPARPTLLPAGPSSTARTAS